MSDSEKTIAVLFHGPACPDGFGAMWAAATVLQDNADYIPVNYGDPLPNLESYTTLYIVDFSYPAATLQELAKDRDVIVLDHHKTAEENLKGLVLPNHSHIHFDMNQSGAVLTWKHFHPSVPVPRLLEYVQDRDLWKWQLPWSKEISAALDLRERSSIAWSNFNQELLDDDGFNMLVQIGSAILKYINQKVDIACKKANFTVVGGQIVPVVNSAIWQSEIGERLCEIYEDRADFSAVFYVDKDGKHKYSLRSRNGYDVSIIARAYGGGGHKAAAGFTMPDIA